MSTSTVREAPGGAPAPSGGPVRGQRGASASRSRPGTGAGGAITLTGRGGIVAMFGTALLGALLAHWFDTPLLAGAGFALGCVAAALLTRQSDLLTLAVSPPLVFLAATFTAAFLNALGQGSVLRGMAVGVLTALAGTAPWVFAGTLLVLGITAPRGLLTQAKELRGKLAGMRLFMEEENEDPVRWDDTPGHRAPRSPHADVD